MSRVILSTVDDPYDNLAAEERLLYGLPPEEELFFLYVNRPAVVWGRFQNPWKECRIALARREGFALCRRISGGGTVVHDAGNLNISFMVSRPRLDREGTLDRVIAVLRELGIVTRRNQRYDLVIDRPDGERKISGSAYRKTKDRSLHHLTLLVSSDLPRLGALLASTDRAILAKGTPSVASPVANLADLRPDLDIPTVIDALVRAVSGDRSTGKPERWDPRHLADPEAFLRRREEIAAYDWVFGKTPPFTETFRHPVGIEVTVEKGRIVARRPEASHNAFLLGLRYAGETILTAGSALGGEAARLAAALAPAVDGGAAAESSVLDS